MEDEETIALTDELIRLASTNGSNFGWKHERTDAIGVSQLEKGWRQRLVGMRVTKAQLIKFLGADGKSEREPAVASSLFDEDAF